MLNTINRAPNIPLRHKIVILWGLCLLFITQVPVLEVSLPGIFLRYLILAGAVMLLIVNLPRILPSLGLFEVSVIGYFILAITISSAAGIWSGFPPDLVTFIKFLILNVFIYFIARSLDSKRSIEIFLHIYYLLALISAFQGIMALVADYWGIRQLGVIPITDGGLDSAPYSLTWYGLLGGDVGNFRTNFFFSESSYFAHFLFPAIGYALAKEKRVGLFVLIAGLLSSFSAAALIALVGFLSLWSLRFLKLRSMLCFFIGIVVITAPLAMYFTQNESVYLLLTDRTYSINDKMYTYQVAFQWLLEHPLGSGLIDTDDYFGLAVNTSGGLFNYIIWFGWLAWPFVFMVTGSLLVTGLIARHDHLYSGMALSMFFLCVASISHGPLIKYYMVFFLGLCASYWSIRCGRYSGNAKANVLFPQRTSSLVK